MARKSPAASKQRKSKGGVKVRLLQLLLIVAAAGAAGCALLAAYVALIVLPNLPPLDALTDYRPKIPLRVYTADQVLIGEFGEERRDFVRIADMPKVMKDAIIAIEDANFYQHSGVDYSGIARAMVMNLGASRSQGASTITMQVARNFYLTKKKEYSRKIQEIVLSYRIEQKLTKDQILELYMNQIYLGERAYGFGSAARIYFGKEVGELTIAEAAMLAGLPKAPSTANPVVNPTRAKQRQQYILKRMHELGYITPAQYEQAQKEKLQVRSKGYLMQTHAEHAAEIVRQYMFEKYKDDVYTHGYTVYTTLNSTDQDAAYDAVRKGVLDYDRRHGYRGPEDYIDLPSGEDDRAQAIDEILVKHPDSGDMRAAVVLAASSKLVRAELISGEVAEITGESLKFAASALNGKGKNQIRPGTVIRVSQDAKKRWWITQLPEVSAAFVSINANDGSFRAMVGGFDYNLNKFDHVTQAWRQPGSSIKPFIYSAALEKGFSPGTMVNDAPLEAGVADGGQAWNPQNDDGNYDGPVTMRTGLKRSKNLVSIRILQAITPPFALQHLSRFGFEADKHPSNLTLTLGTGSVTPLQMASAYAVFANGGFQVAPYLIQKVTDARGNVLVENKPSIAGDENARVLDARNSWLVDSMLRDVVNSGTGFAASQRLGRRDLAGKTGTTNDAMDGWFAGYGGDIVAVAWMGYDKPRSLGGREYGGTVALPVWIDYMRTALKGKPPVQRPVPEGLVQVDGDWMYEEYKRENAAVESVGIDALRSFWDKLFGSRPSAPAAPPAGREVRPPQEDMSYRSGN
ncbi:penicillin-binding protein 1A [Noviherbaspirillum denitrificans]|uniref:Penicillin-binding protein 1A n=1 Tax=Noviherbaspirillum denitrificans TaxID=1968433 RepID=A0A254TAQ6_9BURK|nr:penicillin-binding protein 1A [Noviherbaspirillum denitrificans]OWW19645.1 penicillin-binding protein [Noviherbaspirillum denitrificans]